MCKRNYSKCINYEMIVIIHESVMSSSVLPSCLLTFLSLLIFSSATMFSLFGLVPVGMSSLAWRRWGRIRRERIRWGWWWAWDWTRAWWWIFSLPISMLWFWLFSIFIFFCFHPIHICLPFIGCRFQPSFHQLAGRNESNVPLFHRANTKFCIQECAPLVHLKYGIQCDCLLYYSSLTSLWIQCYSTIEWPIKLNLDFDMWQIRKKTSFSWWWKHQLQFQKAQIFL